MPLLAEQTWTNPRTGAWVKASSVGDNMVMERVIKPGTGKADAHVHLEVPPGTAHRNPFNDTDGDLHLRHTVAPGSAFAEAFVTSLGHHMERDTVNDQGEFSDLQLFVVLRGTRAKSYRAGIPVALQKPVIALGALLGRLRGYKPGY
jgi:hypothetical protein